MVDATISRARLRDLARLGRSRPAQPGEAGLRRPFARPRAARSRPGSDDLMASTIERKLGDDRGAAPGGGLHVEPAAQQVDALAHADEPERALANLSGVEAAA